jgi:Thiamine pyrophosphate enzyme, N-terminal TPP binding domain
VVKTYLLFGFWFRRRIACDVLVVHAATEGRRLARPEAELALGICRLFFLFQERNDDGDSLFGPVTRIVDHRRTVVDVVEKIGVKQIFGLFGDSLNPLADAVRHSKIEWIGVRHEEEEAFATEKERSGMT